MSYALGQDITAPPPAQARNWWQVVGWGLLVATAAGIFWGVASGPVGHVTANRRRRRTSKRRRRSSRRRISRNAARRGPDRSWASRGGKYEVRLDGKSLAVREYVSGRQQAASVGHKTYASAMKKAQQLVRDAQVYDRIRLRERKLTPNLHHYKALSASARSSMPDSYFALSGRRFPIRGPVGSSRERDKWQAMQAIRYLNMGRVTSRQDYLDIRNAIIRRYGAGFWRSYDGPAWPKIQSAKRKRSTTRRPRRRLAANSATRAHKYLLEKAPKAPRGRTSRR